jgi:hypothetical protein
MKKYFFEFFFVHIKNKNSIADFEKKNIKRKKKRKLFFERKSMINKKSRKSKRAIISDSSLYLLTH